MGRKGEGTGEQGWRGRDRDCMEGLQGWAKKHKGAGMGPQRGGIGKQDWEIGAGGKGTEYSGSRYTCRTRTEQQKRSKDRDAGTEKQGWGSSTRVSPTVYFAQSYLYCQL